MVVQRPGHFHFSPRSINNYLNKTLHLYSIGGKEDEGGERRKGRRQGKEGREGGRGEEEGKEVGERRV